MNKGQEKILTLHPQGKKGVNILKRRYDLIADYIVQTLKVAGAYTFLAFRVVNKVRKRLSESHSGEIRNVLNWLQIWIAAAVVFFIVTYLTVELFVSAAIPHLHLTFVIVSAFLTIYIGYISFWSLKKPEVFSVPKKVFFLVHAEKEIECKKEEVDELIKSVREVLEREKLFLDPDLSLSDLSAACTIPSGRLSKLINSSLKTNFYDMINDYRIEEFKSRLASEDYNNLTMEGLAYECGFRSKSTFYSFFKRRTGQSPSSFKKSLENKSV